MLIEKLCVSGRERGDGRIKGEGGRCRKNKIKPAEIRYRIRNI